MLVLQWSNTCILCTAQMMHTTCPTSMSRPQQTPRIAQTPLFVPIGKPQPRDDAHPPPQTGLAGACVQCTLHSTLTAYDHSDTQPQHRYPCAMRLCNPLTPTCISLQTDEYITCVCIMRQKRWKVGHDAENMPSATYINTVRVAVTMDAATQTDPHSRCASCTRALHTSSDVVTD
jgi:hypothetical protein